MLRCIQAFALATVIVSQPAFAAPTDALPRIVVVGHGSVSTDPNVATLTFSIRGEGTTSDAAAAELVRKRAAIADGLATLLGSEVQVHTGELTIKEARDKACDRSDDEPRLSTGACVVRGYVASMDGSLRITPVKDAGTALALASRLGGSDAQLTEYSLRDPSDARRRAEAAAIADARTRASGIAAASGSRLGALISVEDQEAQNASAMDIMVTARRRENAPAPVMPPVVIELKPLPIETTAALTVAYAVVP